MMMMIAVGLGRFVKVEGKINGTKYREILEDNLIQPATKLQLETIFILQWLGSYKET